MVYLLLKLDPVYFLLDFLLHLLPIFFCESCLEKISYLKFETMFFNLTSPSPRTLIRTSESNSDLKMIVYLNYINLLLSIVKEISLPTTSKESMLLLFDPYRF